MGTEAEWRENVGAPGIGNPLLIAAVSLAFSGPLLAMLGMDNGGGLHFRGSSSCGKSLTVRAAVSVWGSPNFVQSWRATSSGLESVAAASNGTVLALDELAEVLAKDCFEAVYMLANGTGKTRAEASATPARP
jgi:putative DNA primase/helicase